MRVGLVDMCLVDHGDSVPVRVARLSDVQREIDDIYNDDNVQAYFEGLGKISEFGT